VSGEPTASPAAKTPASSSLSESPAAAAAGIESAAATEGTIAANLGVYLTLRGTAAEAASFAPATSNEAVAAQGTPVALLPGGSGNSGALPGPPGRTDLEHPLQDESNPADAPPDQADHEGGDPALRPEAAGRMLALPAADTHLLDLTLQDLLNEIDRLGERLIDPASWQGTGAWVVAGVVVVAGTEVWRRRRTAGDVLPEGAGLGWDAPEEAGGGPED
jgi:hypothetical protein